MPHLPISRFGRGLFDFDNFFGNSLDFFDPFDRWDLSLRPRHLNSLNWIREPPRLEDRPVNKFRVTLPATGYDKTDITTSIADNVLKVYGRHLDQQDDRGYNAREFSRIFDLPRNIDSAKMTSFLTGGGMLVIEIPFLEAMSIQQHSAQQQSHQQQQIQRSSSGRELRLRSKSPSDFYRGDFMPRIVELANGARKLQMDVHLPNYLPEEIQLTLKDRDLILKAESSQTASGDKQQQCARQYLYRQVTLPANTNTNQLVSTFEDGSLHIEAPLLTDSLGSSTIIPIQQ